MLPTTRLSTIDFISLIMIFLILVFQVIRIFFGLDLTDEMQYYGEISSLINTGKMFSSDLFYQQIVYIFFYPIFKIFYLINPDLEYLIIFCRTVFAVLLIGTSVFGYLFFKKNGSDTWSASVSSILIVLSVPLYNLYAINYNNISMILIYFILIVWLLKESIYNIRILAILISLLLWIYPPLGVIIACLIFGDLALAKKYVNWINIIGWILLVNSIFVFSFWSINSFQFTDLVGSLVFSKSFGVAKTIFSSIKQILLFGGLTFLMLVVTGLFYLNIPISKYLQRYSSVISILFFFFIVIEIIAIFSETWQHFANFFGYLAILLLLLIKNIDGLYRQQVIKILMISVTVSTTMSMTSGNGIFQYITGFLVAIPFLYNVLAISVIRSAWSNNQDIISVRVFQAFGGLLLIMQLCILIAYPYRDQRIWDLDSNAIGVPIFSGLVISKEKSQAIGQIQHLLSDLPVGRKIMIVGPQPWIYFVIKAIPDTDMFFMHFRGEAFAFLKLADKLVLRNPEYILVTVDDMPVSISQVIANMVATRNYTCNIFMFDKELNSRLKTQTGYDITNRIAVCKRADSI